LFTGISIRPFFCLSFFPLSSFRRFFFFSFFPPPLDFAPRIRQHREKSEEVIARFPCGVLPPSFFTFTSAAKSPAKLMRKGIEMKVRDLVRKRVFFFQIVLFLLFFPSCPSPEVMRGEGRQGRGSRRTCSGARSVSLSPPLSRRPSFPPFFCLAVTAPPQETYTI